MGYDTMFEGNCFDLHLTCPLLAIISFCFFERGMVFGMMIYSGGGSYGRPVIYLGSVGMSQNIESFRELFVTYGMRFAEQMKG